MNINEYRQLAAEISKETGFALGKEMYHGTYYTQEKVRDVIFEGIYEEKPAILKIYDDPRLNYEPVSQEDFAKTNQSKILKAPKVYKYKIISNFIHPLFHYKTF